MSHVLLRNKTTKAVWACPEGAVAGWKEAGWETAPKDAVPTAEQPAIAAGQAAEETR